MASERMFTPAVIKFLRELAENNNRGWFEQNKPRYLQEARDPALRFISGCRLTQKTLTGPGFMEEFAAICRTGAPFMKYLCGALKVEF